MNHHLVPTLQFGERQFTVLSKLGWRRVGIDLFRSRVLSSRQFIIFLFFLLTGILFSLVFVFVIFIREILLLVILFFARLSQHVALE